MISDNDALLREWVRLYTKEMLSWAVRRTSDNGAAEDLVQDTFLVATEKFSSFRGESQPRTWLFAILNNKIAEYHRRKSRAGVADLTPSDIEGKTFLPAGAWREEEQPLPWEEADEHLFNNAGFVGIFEECLSALPAAWHECLTAKFIANRPPDEICQDLGISTTNYWQIIHRAKLQMRLCLEKHWFAKT